MNTETQSNQPIICEAIKNSIRDRIAEERLQQRIQMSENYQAIAPRIKEINLKDSELPRVNRAEPEVVFSRR